MKHEPVKDHAERKRLLALIERCEKEQTISDALIKREDVLNVLKLYGYLPLDSLYYTIEHDLPSADTDISEYSDKLWKNAYERGKADRPQGEWIIHYRDKWMVRAECPKCHRRFEFSPRVIWKCCPVCETCMKGAGDETAND